LQRITHPAERSATLSAARRYYPGFFGATFLVLLRIAIGWHFLYEGLEKLESRQKGGKSFSAEPYLRASTGPLGSYFRGLVPDVNGLAKLDPTRLRAAWTDDVERLVSHYAFDDKQKTEASKALRKSLHEVDEWFADKEFAEKRAKYIHELAGVQKVEQNLGALSYERERAAAKRKDLDVDRKELLTKVDAIGNALRDSVVKLASDEQEASAGPYIPPRTSIDWVNDATTYGLIIMGFCLIVGLCTPLAALAGAVFLGQIYLSMPPWPGLPASPTAEGHYLIVNKNLIEMLALLALVFIPTGQWIGFDALVFGRKEPQIVEETPSPRAGSPAPPSGTNPNPNPRPAPDVKPIPLSSPGVSNEG
jgi:uncharacterized membrane protein YphA (DoxX/SURF4 family)